MAVPEFKTLETIEAEMRADSATELPQLTNWRSGGVLRGLVYIMAKALALAYTALAAALEQAFAGSASGDYLDAQAEPRGIARQAAQAARGSIRFYRTGSSGNVNIPAGTLVGTQTTAAGERLTYSVDETTVLLNGQTEVAVAITATAAGAAYNVGQGTIDELVAPLAGIDGVANDRLPSWIDTVGTDEETDEELRARLLLAWEQLSAGAGRESYRAWALAVNGVEEAAVDDTQPRGAGTIDVMILATGGVAPPAELLAAVQAYIDARSPLCADVLVKAPTPVAATISVTVSKHPYQGEMAALLADLEGALAALFTADADYPDVPLLGIGDDLTRARIYQICMSRPFAINCTIAAPAADLVIDYDEKAVLSSLTVVVDTPVEG